MPMTAIAFAIPAAVLADPHPTVEPGEPKACDFSGDGRRCRAGDRSALACPSFYLAIPACALLCLAVLIVRLCGLLGRSTR
ncbi:hypothetical protein [Sphingomonas sp. R86521]|uniref:hypothetical protein n=1 Tax=Sphingomonas sp. R86521 TaxID=3093860 RepID=UPI0036D2BB18